MSDTVYKKIEVVGTSGKSFSDAVANAVDRAGSTVRNTAWFEVIEQRGRINEGKIDQYQVTVKIGFRLE